MFANKNKDFEKYKKELFSVEDIREKIELLIHRDLQMRFSLKFFNKDYPDEEMDKNIVLAFQAALYMLGEYDEKVDYSDNETLANAFLKIKENIIPTAKEVIEQNLVIRELVFRFNKTSLSLFRKLYASEDKISEIVILRKRDNILNTYFTNPDEYPEPESVKILLKLAQKFEKEVIELEKVFKKNF